MLDVTKVHATLPRGRPFQVDRRNIVKEIMAATESVMIGKTYKDITLSDVAAAAGTNKAMIRYYFGDKNGLLAAMLNDLMQSAPHRFIQAVIPDRCTSVRSIRPLVDVLVDFYYARPNFIRMLLVEFTRENSEVKLEYAQHYASQTPILTRAVMTKMRDEHIYRAGLDVDLAAISFISLITGPIMRVTAMSELSVDIEHARSTEWRQLVTQMIDRGCS